MAATTHLSGALPLEKQLERTGHLVSVERQVQGMLGGLSAQFVLGLALATVAGYDADTHTGNHAVYQIVLTLHSLLAIGLLVGSILLVRAVIKQTPKLMGLAVTGLVAIIVSFVAGLARLSVDAEWLTFIMGTGFIVAISVYGRLLGEVLKRSEN